MRHIDEGYQVHKFGGSSVANASCFAILKEKLCGKNEIIVVSAMLGTTSILQTLLEDAKSGRDFLNQLRSLEELHQDTIQSILIENAKKEISASIQKDMVDIKGILEAVTLMRTYSKEIEDMILGYGELWSAKILSSYLSEFSNVLYLDASLVVYKYEKNGMIGIDWNKSQRALDHFLENKSFDQIVITGFIASTLDGKRTTLGRNGSDFSAAIFAKLFQAKSLTIWTDVDGIFTADPNKVRRALVIDALSYKEALELAYFGAKVLHPMTIAPVLDQKIPITIKNSFNPGAKGTDIRESSSPSSYLIKGLTCIDNIALINIEGTGMIGVTGVASRVFETLHREDISVILIAQASSEHSICFAVSNQYADDAIAVLHEDLQLEIKRQHLEGICVDKECAILSVVGDKMVGTLGVAGKLLSALAKANINIRAISQGSSERNISVVVEGHDMNKALQAVHAGFYLSCKTISIGLIGPGQVGSVLLSQIQNALEQLNVTYQVNLLVRGIMNSSHMLLSHESIDLSTWQKQMQDKAIQSDLQAFTKHILLDDVPHAVIIDCTANPNIATQYIHFLEKGIHVITPNKHANAGDVEYYQKLKSFTRGQTNHYLYEATVCAGLPIINTLQDLIKTGDVIHSIEGIVSGTLSYIFNEMAKDRTFSEVVLEAREKGFTEPDPREDLSGMDVARKLVCLAREVGFDVALSDVAVHNLVPEPLRSCSVDEFMNHLSAYDHHMEKIIAEAKMNHERIAYVGAIHQDGAIHVAIKSFQQNHPFVGLKGTDNMLIFHTNRYHVQPLIIQGPGAGAEVTAGGIFADLLRLVSFLS